MALVYTVAMGLSAGAAAVVARRIGEQDSTGAAVSAVQALLLGGLVSVGIGVLGGVFAREALALMGANAVVLDTGVEFTRIMLGGSVGVMLLFLANAIHRGAGDAAVAMRALWLANGLNIAVAPLLIFGLGPVPALGLAGAAVATAGARFVGAVYSIAYLFRPTARMRLTRAHLVVVPDIMRRIVSLSGAATLQMFIGMASWIGLVRVVSSFGSNAIAGYTIGMRVVMFALLPSFGLANAAATMVGQALGAGKPDRAEQAVWLAGFYNLCFLGAVGAVFVIFPQAIVSIFTADAAVQAYASSSLRIVAAGFLFYAYGMVLTQSFNGAGDTYTPTMINLVVYWLIEIPLAYVLAVQLGMGPQGVFVAVAVSFSLLAVISAVLFRRGKWKQQAV